MMAFAADGDPISNCFTIAYLLTIGGDTMVQADWNLSSVFFLLLMVSQHDTQSTVETIIANPNTQCFDDHCYHAIHHDAKPSMFTTSDAQQFVPASNHFPTITKSHANLAVTNRNI